MNQSWLDDYEPGDVIGNGSFGVIRKVTRKSDGLPFARKELHFERMSEKDRKQIVAEVNILKELSHDNIVRYHDRCVDRDRGILYILMEYCGGGDLGSVLNKARKSNSPLAEDKVWRYFYQIVLALHYCHQSGSESDDFLVGGVKKSQQVLHRDIKPENVFLSEDGNVKLGDFGLSKQMGVQMMTYTYVGTPYYMSPEMIEERAYDIKSDIWSLGCLIYELCALRPPFHEAKTHSELASLIKSGRIPPLPRGYSQALGNLIKSMLNLNPASRPSTRLLLNSDRFQHVRTVLETEHLLVEARLEKEAVQTREKSLIAREEELKTHARRIEQENLHVIQERKAMEAERSRFEQDRLRTLDDLRAQRGHLIEGRKQLEADRELFDKSAKSAHAEYTAFQAEREKHKRQKELFDREVAEFNRQRAQSPAEANHTRKQPFEEVQNQKNSIPLPRPRSRLGSPTKTSFNAKPSESRSQDENNPPSINPRHITPSARGARLASKSNPNLGSAMKGVVLTSTGIALETPSRGETHSVPPLPDIPSVPALPPLLDDARMRLDSPESTKLCQSESEAPRNRLRRRSTVSSGRPSIQHSATAPTNIPPWNPDLLPPPPVYDLKDEANLPSPFIKKNLPETEPTRSGWNTIKAGLKKGPGLWGIATSNSTAAAGKPSGSSSQANTGTTAKMPRSSISKALKASEDAQRALQRRAK